jgi:hypothetical protein
MEPKSIKIRPIGCTGAKWTFVTSRRNAYASKVHRAARTLAFTFALAIVAVGIMGIVLPAALVWIAREFVVSGALAFYLLAAVRIAFGLILIAAASASRAPRGLRVLGGIIVVLGIVTALAGSVAVERSQAAIDGWAGQRSVIVRLTSGLILALGSFVAYACAPRSEHG